MSVVLGTRARRRRWPIWVAAAAALGVALAAFTLWRPLTVVNTATRARLFLAGVREGVAMSGPYRIHYLVAGSGRPILLLHGLAGNGQQLGDYIEALGTDGRVYAPDLLGYGESEQPDVDYSMPLQAEVVRGFLDTMNVGQADILGVSMGGWVAAEFASRHPKRVRRLVLADAGGLLFDPATPMPFIPRDTGEIPRLEQLLGSRTRLVPAFAAADVVRQMARYRWVADRFLERRRAGKDFLDGQLGPITMPVLLLWGSEDAISPLRVAEAFHREIPQSELVVLKGCGHIALSDCRSHAQPEIVSFLAAASPARGGRRQIAVF